MPNIKALESLQKRRRFQTRKLKELRTSFSYFQHDVLKEQYSGFIAACKLCFTNDLLEGGVDFVLAKKIADRLGDYDDFSFVTDPQFLSFSSREKIKLRQQLLSDKGYSNHEQRREDARAFFKDKDQNRAFREAVREISDLLQAEYERWMSVFLEKAPAFSDICSDLYRQQLRTFAQENILSFENASVQRPRKFLSQADRDLSLLATLFAEKVLGHATPYCDETILDLDALSYQDCTLYGKTLRDKSLIDEDDHATIDAYVLSRKVHDRPKATEQEIDPRIHFLETCGVDEMYLSKIAQRMSRRVISEEDVAARVELLHDAGKANLLQDNPYLLVTDEDRFFRTLEKTHGQDIAAHEDTGRIEKEDPELESFLCAAYVRLEPYLDYFEENERLKVLDTMCYFGSKGPRGGDFVTAIIKDFKFLYRNLDIDDCSGFANDTSYMVVLPKHLQEKIPDIHNRIQEYL